MASTAIQAFQHGQHVVYQNSWPGYTFTDLAPDVDMISILPEYLGIPYAQFAESDTLFDGDPWAQQMVAMADSAKQAGKPLMVQIALVRHYMVGKASYPEGLVQVQNDWAPLCPDLTKPEYANLSKSYVNYALWVARTFSPQYFVIMIEPNIYYAGCGGNTPSWKILVNIEREVYQKVKAAFPSMVLFPSFNLENLYGIGALDRGDATGFDHVQYYSLLAMKRDRLGLSSFPQIIRNPYQLPIDYYTRILDYNPNEPSIVVTEAGWNSSGVGVYLGSFNTCTSFYSEPSFATEFLKLLFYSAYAAKFDVLSLWSHRDVLPADVAGACYPPAAPPNFPECNGDAWCAWVNSARSRPAPGATPEFGELGLKAFGVMGVRRYDGSPKDGMLSLWNQFLQLPIVDGTDAPAVPRQLLPVR